MNARNVLPPITWSFGREPNSQDMANPFAPTVHHTAMEETYAESVHLGPRGLEVRNLHIQGRLHPAGA
jgi:hypothetical protein